MREKEERRKRPIDYIKIIKQKTPYSCGPACIEMMLSCFGITYTQKEIIEINDPEKSGYDWSDVFSILYPSCQLKIRFQNHATYEDMMSLSQEGFPIMVRYQKFIPDGDHFSIVYKAENEHTHLIDPAIGKVITLPRQEFESKWFSKDDYRSFLCILG